jgi:hypothetical protein
MTFPANTTSASVPTSTPAPSSAPAAAPNGIVSSAVNPDGSFTGANGANYTPGQVSMAQNQISNDNYAEQYYRNKFGSSMPAPTSFGMPGEVINGDQAGVRAWIDGMTPPPAPPSGAPATPAPAPSTGIVNSARGSGYTAWNMTPEQTVEGRIQSIINPGNPIIASARADAVDTMNARGLANSTLAITAADKAAYAAAIPIAQQDAATAAKSVGYNADIQNQMSMQNRQLGSAESIAQLQADTQRFTAGLSADTQKFVAGLQSDTQQAIAGLDNTNKVQLQGMVNDNSRLLQTNQNAATAFNQSMVAVANIQNNDKMDGPAKTQAIASIMQNLQMQLKTLGTVANIDLSGTLDFRNMPGFDASGNWVGFAAGAPAPGGGGNGGGGGGAAYQGH